MEAMDEYNNGGRRERERKGGTWEDILDNEESGVLG